MAQYPAELSLYIDGEWLGAAGRATHRVINPATGEALGELPLATPPISTARWTPPHAASGCGARTPRRQSAAACSRARPGLMRERADASRRIATLEEGKTLAEAQARSTDGRRTCSISTPARAAHLWPRAGAPGGHALAGDAGAGRAGRRLLRLEFPDRQSRRASSAPPIAAGCSVILKPAEEAPASAIEVLHGLLDAGLPEDVGQLRVRRARRGVAPPARLARSSAS